MNIPHLWDIGLDGEGAGEPGIGVAFCGGVGFLRRGLAAGSGLNTVYLDKNPLYFGHCKQEVEKWREAKLV